MPTAEIPRDFGFREEHEVLREQARRFLGERCPTSELRRLAEDALGHDPKLYREICELGWTGLVFPEELGGAGMDSLALALLLEEMGRVCLPSPFLGALFAGMAIEEGGSDAQCAELLPAIASGECLATFGLCEHGGAWLPEELRAVAEPAGKGWRLSGEKVHVPTGMSADLLVAPFLLPSGEPALFAVPLSSPGIHREAEIGVDPTRRCARIALAGVEVPAGARLEAGDRDALARATLRATAALAAEMVGGAERALVMTRDYAIERKQFGRAIGSFQAIKHPLVNVMIGVELSRTHALAAAAALDYDPEAAEVPVRMAKAMVSEVFPEAVRRGVQFHGGFGFTLDCDMHFYFKRAMWSRSMLGDATHHRRALARELFGRET